MRVRQNAQSSRGEDLVEGVESRGRVHDVALLRAGLAELEGHLRTANRPRTSLCARHQRKQRRLRDSAHSPDWHLLATSNGHGRCTKYDACETKKLATRHVETAGIVLTSISPRKESAGHQ